MISVIFYDDRASGMVASGRGKIIILGLFIKKQRPTCGFVIPDIDCNGDVSEIPLSPSSKP
jgi:hypothetical protein